MLRPFCKPIDVCTLALYYKEFPGLPLLVAANRDEHYDRPSAAPGILDTKPKIIAGKDLRVGGTWMGVSEAGLFVGILNRRGNGDAVPNGLTRSRGLLCMDLLMHASAGDGQRFIESHQESYQPFTVVMADSNRAWAAHNGGGGLSLTELTPGLHVFSSHAEVDWRSDKGDRAAKQFATLLEGFDVSANHSQALLARLQVLLSDHSVPANGTGARGEAICVHGEVSGTVSASVVALIEAEQQFTFFHCPGPPCRNDFSARLELPIR